MFTNPFQSAISTRLLGLFLVATLVLFSCGKDEVMEEEVFVPNPFAGTWTGSISGDVSGTVNMTLVVQEDGNGFMDFTSLIPFSATYFVEVTEDGILEGGRETTTETTMFTGTLTAARGAGDWETVQLRNGGEVSGKGRWSIDKEE